MVKKAIQQVRIDLCCEEWEERMRQKDVSLYLSLSREEKMRATDDLISENIEKMNQIAGWISALQEERRSIQKES